MSMMCHDEPKRGNVGKLHGVLICVLYIFVTTEQRMYVGLCRVR